MSQRKIHAPIFWFVLLCCLVFLTFPYVSSNAQFQESKQEPSWQIKLYEKDVKYENFVCRKEDSETVATFFKEHPLRSILPICHNDCPVIKCRPVILFPPIAKAAKVTGTVSVHILVGEQGKVLYARPLSGHPLLWAATRKAACETQFNVYPDHKRQGVMHFTVDNYEYLSVPYRANEVR